ncbi:hypothetical protein GTI81_07640 [Enterococcus faecalis]|uniref:Uncharacterized protein n=1 Tax=Enterococcus faecalis TaxID=1351 RepID=A0AAP6V8C9_ENTFL|nr:hypothetical protein [Enterococcus faecalis]MXS29383.1 hypothetical protein [Enterococcus faecalis]MXS52580.1 hypothetical protein [Enterococcus faecalis]
MKPYTFNDLYEEIRNETDPKLLAEFYRHWGKPVGKITGLGEPDVKNKELRKELKEKSQKKQWEDRQAKRAKKMFGTETKEADELP